MAFPTDLATFTTVTTGSKQNSPSHLGLHNDLADTVEALEAKVGVNSSAVTTSHDYLLRHLPAQLANVTMGGYRIAGLGAATDIADATQKQQVVLKDGTNKMTGALDMDSHLINNVTSAVNAQDAYTKAQADAYHNVGAFVYLSADQDNIENATWTKILFDTELYDLGSDFASNKFTVDVAGDYYVYLKLDWSGLTADKLYRAAIYKNGSIYLGGFVQASSATGWVSAIVTGIIPLVATDEIEFYGYHAVGAATPDILGVNTYYSNAQVYLVRRA